MFKGVIEKLFAPNPDKIARKLKPKIDEINSLEDGIKSLSTEELTEKGLRFKTRIKDGESLNDILPEVFATVREISKRTLNMRHFDVQLIGGIVLHSGKISEMKTGEGKTLVATLALSLNALEGKGAHLVTVNDYLAKRDATWMAPIYLSLGLSVGIIQHELSSRVEWDDKSKFTVKIVPATRKEVYDCDITYGTNSEFGFDYLRDNMKYDTSEFVQRELNYAIVDEVDSILIDEARTPLIISGPTEETTDKYYNINAIVRQLKPEVHYTIDEKRRQATLTDEGINFCESQLNVGNLYDIENVSNLHFITNALKAHAVFKKDVDYVVKDNQIIIVDEFTGRMMTGRRYSDGLHQALEAKEGVTIQNENQTYASITYQNYFRMYNKLAGMTGTALTEAEEFLKIYGLEVLPIPTHRKMVRIDNPDVIYKTNQEKYEAIANEIIELHKKGQPVLVGTVSIEKSEVISRFLTKRGIKHEVLNAKNHEREANIVMNAGQKGAITIATNMAGRGTDIKLGEGVEELGGLFILATERHESRRIDNQLRGRSGRQGDSGESRFYLSLEDDLLRIFGAERIKAVMSRIGMKDGESIEHSLISRAIEGAQKKVEAMHFEMRKHLLEYDDVANNQRKIIYALRKDILQGKDIDNILAEFATETATAIVEDFVLDQRDHIAGEEMFERIFNYKVDLTDCNPKMIGEKVSSIVTDFGLRLDARKTEFMGHYDEFIKYIMISIIDSRWKEHLLQMDYLRDSVGLRGYGQKDPLIEYKKESFTIFSNLMHRIRKETLQTLMRVKVEASKPAESNAGGLKKLAQSSNKKLVERSGADASDTGKKSNENKAQPVRRSEPKIGRNDPCFCGSGKKYKNCHGA